MSYYQIAPRYTASSPGVVDRSTAECVAEDEKQGYARCLEGGHGDEELKKARIMGLRGIVERKTEKVRGKKPYYEIYDLCTGETHEMPLGDQLTKLGYKHFSHLGEKAKAVITANPPTTIGDYTRTGWFKFMHGDYEVFLPKLA